MDDERRSPTSVGAPMRAAGTWGAWSQAALAAAPMPSVERRQRPRGEAPALLEGMVDPVTGLPTRALLADRLERALRRAKRYRQHTALLFIDIAGRARVLATHGQGAADALMAAVGQRLVQSVREVDTVARLGTDEFAVILEGLHSPAVAERLAQKLADAIAGPRSLLVGTDGRPLDVEVGACVGVAVHPDRARTFDELVAAAELALAQARSAGGVRVYREGADVGSARPQTGTRS